MSSGSYRSKRLQRRKYRVSLRGKVYEVEVEDGQAVLLSEYEADAPAGTAASGASSAAGNEPDASEDAANTARRTHGRGAHEVKAPMPGNIVDVKVKTGDHVKNGQVLMILESMKMENDIISTVEGTVRDLPVSKGSAVSTGDLLAAIS